MRRKAIIALVFIVAAAVLVESWHAAMNAAESGGRPWPLLWPATLEAFIFVLVLVYWDARSSGQRARTARLFLVVTTAVASAVQILDAPHTWLGWLTAGWTPVALLLSVEFAVGRLYATTRPDAVVPTPLGKPVRKPAQPEPDPPPEPEPSTTGPASISPRVTQGGVRRRSPVTRGGPRNGTLPKADMQALDRARKDPVEVERVMLRRGIDRSTVAARPERWPLPSRNGRRNGRPDHVTPTQVRSPGGGS